MRTNMNMNMRMNMNMNKLAAVFFTGLIMAAIIPQAACLEPQRFELDVNSPDGLLSFGLTLATNSANGGNSGTPTYGASLSSSTLNVREGDSASTYTIQLNSQPGADVTVSPGTSGLLSITPASLTFTPDNWNSARTISISGIDNQTRAGSDTALNLTHSLASTDSNFDGLTSELSITLQDNDYFTFIHTSTVSGNMGGIGQAGGIDEKCNNDAARPDTTKTYKAFITGRYNNGATTRRACLTANCGCGTTCTYEATDWVLKPNSGYLRLDGTTYIGTTNTAAIFFPFPLTNSWAPSGQAWTGMQFDWTIPGAGMACQSGSNDWTSTAGSSGGSNLMAATNAGAVSNGSLGCGANVSIICVEQ